MKATVTYGNIKSGEFYDTFSMVVRYGNTSNAISFKSSHGYVDKRNGFHPDMMDNKFMYLTKVERKSATRDEAIRRAVLESVIPENCWDGEFKL